MAEDMKNKGTESIENLPELVQALMKPQAYPEEVKRVELVQTQMSFVFLADDLVYKVKKPVDLGYLDYTTLEKRRFFCQREVELNQRLCSSTYLGVFPITERNNDIAIGGEGEAIEYAVKMRRLPEDRMMNVLLAENRVSPEMVTRVAEKLADFHKRAETGEVINAFGGLDVIARNTDENFTQTENRVGVTISAGKHQRLKRYTNQFIQNNVELFQKRVAEDRIRDCHGDLHAAHICFVDDICIYDCIEFNDRFRYGDVASEVAFLAMDLDHYGRADLSRTFVKDYVTASRDTDLYRLLTLYKCYRACVRGKVEGFKLDDPHIPPAERGTAQEASASYFDLASFYIRTRPVLFITTGLVGTGKTVLAGALAKRLGLVNISSDVTRKQLADIPPTERRYEDFDRGIYSPEFSRKTYDTMFDGARQVLSEGGPVILDASFTRAFERQKAAELAREAGADFFILECTADEETIRQRLERRQKGKAISDGRWEIYGPQKERFEPVTEVPPENRILIDAARSSSENIRHVLERIGEG